MVVDDDRQVVGRESVRLDDDLVVGMRCVGLAADQVREPGVKIGRDEHPHDRDLREAGEGGALFAGLAVAQAVIPGRLLGLLLRLAHLRQPLGGAPAVVGVPALQQPVDIRGVAIEPLGLAVGRERPTDVRALIPVEAQPVQGVEDLRLAVLTEPGLVGVLDPQDELTALLADESQVEERDVCRADVRVAGGRGSNAQANRTR